MAYNLDEGVCYRNSDNGDISLVIIPKNASTSLRKSLNLDQKFNYLTNPEIHKGKIVAVLRNPIDRLVSGYLEVLVRANVDSPVTKTKKFFSIKDGKERFYSFIDEIKKGFFDAHIEPQVFYVKNIPVDKYIRFSKLSDEINKLAGVNIKHLNMKKNKEKLIIYDYINNDDSIKETIKLLYSDDFKLCDKHGC